MLPIAGDTSNKCCLHFMLLGIGNDLLIAQGGAINGSYKKISYFHSCCEGDF